MSAGWTPPIQPTATTVFSLYDLGIMTGTGYYFHTRWELSVDDHVIQMILIDPLDLIIKSYAAARPWVLSGWLSQCPG